jgi:hypothetical protein
MEIKEYQNSILIIIAVAAIALQMLKLSLYSNLLFIVLIIMLIGVYSKETERNKRFYLELVGLICFLGFFLLSVAFYIFNVLS